MQTHKKFIIGNKYKLKSTKNGRRKWIKDGNLRIYNTAYIKEFVKSRNLL